MNQSYDRYRTVKSSSGGTFRSRGSKFVSYLYPIDGKEAVEEVLDEIREAHPKADHFCVASRHGIDPVEEYQSDDREPSGSAGLPILRALQSAELTNCALVVVRYFGGTRLGVPGLIHAYKEAALESIKEAEIIEAVHTSQLKAECNYEQLNELYRISGQFDGKVLVTGSVNERVSLVIEFPASLVNGFLEQLNSTYPLNKNLRIIKD